jgi:alpha-glucosidase
MHTFLKEQPQLNAHNPEVQDALLAVARFWLERGVDGFRLDALNHAMHDRRLRDNPPAPDTGRVRTRPFDFQLKIHSQSQPEMLGFVERIRALCDEYGAIHTVAEVGGDQAQAEMRAYTQGDRRLDSAYGFDFLYASELTPRFVAEALGHANEEGCWPTWAFENHDAPRAVSRWCAPEDADRFARLKLGLLMALRGNVILYQGEELGLEQDEIPFELLQDPEAIANWPLTLSRDGARTPMPWTPGGGFTSGVPWLPQGAANLARSVAAQEGADGSVLADARRLIALRRDTPCLRWGKIDNLAYENAILSFDRTHGPSRVRCIFNLAKTPATCRPPHPASTLLAAINQGRLDFLPGFAAIYVSPGD